MNMRNLSFVFVFARLTTRSLTGVYAEFNEVFEMTELGITTTIKNRDVAEDFSPPRIFQLVQKNRDFLRNKVPNEIEKNGGRKDKHINNSFIHA